MESLKVHKVNVVVTGAFWSASGCKCRQLFLSVSDVYIKECQKKKASGMIKDVSTIAIVKQLFSSSYFQVVSIMVHNDLLWFIFLTNLVLTKSVTSLKEDVKVKEKGKLELEQKLKNNEKQLKQTEKAKSDLNHKVRRFSLSCLNLWFVLIDGKLLHYQTFRVTLTHLWSCWALLVENLDNFPYKKH